MRQTGGGIGDGVVVVPFAAPEQACAIDGDPDAWGPIRSSDEAVIQLHTNVDADYISDISFFDAACAPSTLPAVSQALLFAQRTVYDGALLAGVAVARSNGELVYLDRVSGEARMLSTDLADTVRPFESFGTGDARLWIQESASVVARDVDGTELGRFGTSVTQMVASGERLAFIDAGDLFFAESPGAVPTLVANDACQPVLTRFAQDEAELVSLTFSSPCEGARLNAYDIDTGITRSFRNDVSAWRAVGAWIFFETGNTTLWLVPPGSATPAEIGDGIHFEATIGGDMFLLRLDQSDDAWDLARFQPDEGLVIVASDADDYVLRDGHLAVLHGVDAADGGTLTVFDTTDWTPRFERSRVNRFAVPFTGTLAEVPYFLDYYNELPSRLEYWSPATNDATFVAHGASSFVHIMTEPERGLVYSIAAGETQGIWFAKLPQ